MSTYSSSHHENSWPARVYNIYPEMIEIENMKAYFREKIIQWTDPLVNNTTKRTRENIFKIINKLIESMREESRKWTKRFNYIPSWITYGWKNINPTLTELFDRIETDYETHPDMLLKDLEIQNDYYWATTKWESQYQRESIERNPEFEEAVNIVLEKTPQHPRYWKPKAYEFWLSKKWFVTFIWKSGIPGLDYSELIYRIQHTYEDLLL